MGFFVSESAFIIGENDIVTKRELLQLLNCSRSTVQRLMKKGLPCVQFKNKITAFSVNEVRDWLIENGYSAKNTTGRI